MSHIDDISANEICRCKYDSVTITYVKNWYFLSLIVLYDFLIFSRLFFLVFVNWDNFLLIKQHKRLSCNNSFRKKSLIFRHNVNSPVTRKRACSSTYKSAKSFEFRISYVASMLDSFLHPFNLRH